jgi:hypothetical protein
MIGARRYTQEDYDMISLWWIKHKEIPMPKEAYPKHGFIVDNVACGFLYETDGNFCLIESIMYDPDVPKEIAQKALDEIIQAIIDQGKALGYNVLVGFTDLPVVVERSKKFNFKQFDKKYNMVTRSL